MRTACGSASSLKGINMKTLTKRLFPYHRSRDSRPAVIDYNPMYVDQWAALMHMELERKDNCVVVTEMSGRESYLTIAHKEALPKLVQQNCTLSLGRRDSWFNVA